MVDHSQGSLRCRPALILGGLSLAVAMAAALVSTSQALGIGPDQIPSPRPNGWIVELTGRIPPDTVQALNNLGNETQKQTGAELAVVVIGSTDGADPHQFATNLFNRWRIGQAGKNNGVLVFAALEDRKAEIILGDGITNDGHVQASREIMQGIVVPRFKAGDHGGALYHGARACAERILDAKLDALRAEATDPGETKPVDAAPAPASAQPANPAPPPAQRPAAIQPPLQRQQSSGLGWVFGSLLAVIGTAATGFGTRKFLRYRTRHCPVCRGDMTRLGEAADDQHLTAGERAEEQVGSVDYDVWACGSCRETLKFRYGAFFTRFSRCPSCNFKTRSSTTRTVRAATYSQGGLVEVEETCRNCSYRNIRSHSTPVLSDATTASTAAWSSSSSSPSSSFGGGFSGGHSSGAGASGSW